MSTISASTTSTTAYKVTADTTGTLVLQTGSTPTTAVTIGTDQSVTLAGRTTNPTTISVGNATPSTSGSGITFPATQSASSDANTLDDYEEGTFTPTWTFGGNSVGLTYNFQNGSYVKIGRLVYLTVRIALTAKGSSTGSVRISNIPFIPAIPAGQDMQMGSVWYNTWNNASNYAVNCRADGAVTYIELRSYSGGNELTVDQGWINNTSQVAFSICYETST